MTNRLLLVDGTALQYRSLYGASPLTRSDGVVTGSAVSFCRVLISLLKQFRPTHAACVFDGPDRTFRHLIDTNYKANRVDRVLTPEQILQIRMMRYAVPCFGYYRLDSSPYEADDVLASLAKSFDGQVTLVAADKDSHQVVSKSVTVFDWTKKEAGHLREEQVKKRWGVAPNRVADVQALAGDKTDGITGVNGLGLKRAIEIIQTYGSVENTLLHADEGKDTRLLAGAWSAFVSARLTRLVFDLHYDVSKMRVSNDWPRRAVAFFASLEADSAVQALCKDFRIKESQIVPDYAWQTKKENKHGKRNATKHKPKVVKTLFGVAK